MKTSQKQNRIPTRLLQRLIASCVMLLPFAVIPVSADETCMSPYMAKIVGQEDYIYIWTLGIEGVGDGSDKMVTVDVNPNSPKYGRGRRF